ncbi:MAG: hypothetical protein ACKVXR_10645 [Planctomycetota bacterium]
MALRRVASFLVLALSFSERVAAQCVLQKLLASDGQANDAFGVSVAVHDGRALVGQTGITGPGGGSVYAFRRAPSGWVQGQTLTGSDTAAEDWFGWSAAISGATAVVGAILHDHGGIGGTGAVYVLRFDEGSWHEVQELLGAETQAGDLFGTAVAIDGDVLAATVGGADPGGLACVYERRPQSWIRTAVLMPADLAAGDNFGQDVAVSGTRIVVGKSHDNGLRGAAYVFEKTPQGWVETAKLTASDGAPIDHFGWSVDVDGDRVLVGALAAGTAGAAYLFERTSGAWIERVKFVPPDSPAGGDFGREVCLERDRALVSMPETGSKLGPAGPGAIYVYRPENGAWPFVARISPTDGIDDDGFGRNLSADGETLFASATGDDDLGSFSGSVRVLQLPEFAQTYGHCAGAGACGNGDPVAGCANSTNRGARLGACGSGSLARDDFSLIAEGMPPARPVVFFRGGAAADAPLGDGRRHVAAGSLGLRRFAPTVAAPNGIASLGPGSLTGSDIAPGQTWFFQAWYADPAGPCGAGFNASNAVRAVFGP